MNKLVVRSNLLLFTVAFIWGSAFVAQRMGLDHVGPHFFNAVRFSLAALFLLPFIYIYEWKLPQRKNIYTPKVFIGGLFAGVVLFAGATFQQVGLGYTTAGKAGFITGLYVVLVPLIGMFLKIPIKWNTFAGALIAATGLYFLSVTEDFTMSYGDVLELIGAFFWAGHILILDRYSPHVCPLRFTLIQIIACAVLSMGLSLSTEELANQNFWAALPPMAYSGLLSIGIAYTLQIVGQRHALPSHAAIILSLEAVVAAFAGWLILNEILNNQALFGCGLMLFGMVISQFPFKRKGKKPMEAASYSQTK